MQPNSQELTQRVDLDRYFPHSGKIAYEDLDWGEARRAGLTPEERFVVTYFSDIESQTILYMRDILNTKGALDSEVIAFLTIWNYEEFFHGKALAKLLEECGAPLGQNRIAHVRKRATLRETWNALGAKLFSKIHPEAFIALYMTWGATNEITTLRGYEAIESKTENPTLKELCNRIAKQERRHFAWYFNSAAERLRRSPSIQRIVRWVMEKFWTPVGAGVKKDEEVYQLFNTVFPGTRGDDVAKEIDGRISELPGLSGLSLMTRFAGKAA